MSNTYKFSTRDEFKHITCNGVDLRPWPMDFQWGWYGTATNYTAWIILEKEYGPKTADQYYEKFSRHYLADQTCDNFELTSGAIALILKDLDAPHPTLPTG